MLENKRKRRHILMTFLSLVVPDTRTSFVHLNNWTWIYFSFVVDKLYYLGWANDIPIRCLTQWTELLICCCYCWCSINDGGFVFVFYFGALSKYRPQKEMNLSAKRYEQNHKHANRQIIYKFLAIWMFHMEKRDMWESYWSQNRVVDDWSEFQGYRYEECNLFQPISVWQSTPTDEMYWMWIVGNWNWNCKFVYLHVTPMRGVVI